MKLWIDDVRPAPIGKRREILDNSFIIWEVFTYEES